MSKRIEVTGYFEIDDREYDPGPLGPLTEAGFDMYVAPLHLDDVEYRVVGFDVDGDGRPI